MQQKTAEMELARAEEELARRSIRAPVDGVVVEVTVAPGEYTHEQAPILTIAELDPLHVEVFVPIARYDDLDVGMPAKVGAELFDVEATAHIAVIDRVFDPASATFGVRLHLPNPDYEILAGQRCRLRFLPE